MAGTILLALLGLLAGGAAVYATWQLGAVHAGWTAAWFVAGRVAGTGLHEAWGLVRWRKPGAQAKLVVVLFALLFGLWAVPTGHLPLGAGALALWVVAWLCMHFGIRRALGVD